MDDLGFPSWAILGSICTQVHKLINFFFVYERPPDSYWWYNIHGELDNGTEVELWANGGSEMFWCSLFRFIYLGTESLALGKAKSSLYFIQKSQVSFSDFSEINKEGGLNIMRTDWILIPIMTYCDLILEGGFAGMKYSWRKCN